MGKLLALEHLLKSLEDKNLLHSEQLLIALDIAYHNLTKQHSRVAKMALKIFVAATTALISIKDTASFEQVWRLVLSTEETLQQTLRRKIKSSLR